MKVLCIINRFNIGGICLNVAYLVKHLPDKYKTFVVGGMREENEGSSLYMFDRLSVKYTVLSRMKRNINPINDLIVIIKIISLIKRIDPDIIHTHASKAGFVGRIAKMLSFAKKPILVHTFHGNVFDGYFSNPTRRIILFIERFLSNYTDAIVSVSNIQKRELVEKYKICPEKKVYVIPIGIDLKPFESITSNERRLFRDEFKLDDDVVVVTIVGRLVSIKNHYLFIDIISLLKLKSRYKVKAFIVGDGEEKQFLLEYARRKKLSTSIESQTDLADIIFTSWRIDLPAIYAGSDFVLLTSLNEGSPVSIIEAMASSKIVISTDAGGVSEIIDSDSGFVCPFDAEYFVTAMLELLSNPYKMKIIEKNAKSTVKNKFNYTRLCNDVDNLYQALYELKIGSMSK